MKTTFKKVLSLILCFVMIFSTAAFAFAADNNSITYKSNYFYTQKTSTDTKNADIVLDKIDEILKEADIYIDLGEASGLLKGYSVDLRSINGLCKTIDSFEGILKAAKLDFTGALLGDLSDISVKNWVKNMKRSSSNDIKILEVLLQLLADNSKLIGKIVDGTIKLGVLKNFVNLEELLGKDGIYGLIKKLIVGLIYKDENSTEFTSAYEKKLDNFIYEDVLGLINKEDGVLPGFTMDYNTNVDSLLLSIFKVCYGKYLVPLINELNIDIFDAKDNEALIKIKELLNLDGSKFTNDTVKIDTTKTFSSQINNILKDFINFFVPSFNGWVSGGTDKIGSNLTALYRFLAEQFGIDTKGSDADIAVRVVNYVLTQIKDAGILPELNDYVTGVNSNMTIETLITMVLNNTAKAQNIPVKAGGNYEQILGDMLGYFVQPYVDISYKEASGTDIWTVLNNLLNVFLIDKGFAKALNINVTAKNTFFEKVDTILKMTGTKFADHPSKDFIGGLLNALFKFDIAKAVDLTVVTFLEDYANEKAIKVIYDAVYNLMKNCLGAEIIVKYNDNNKLPLDNAIQNSSLKTTVKNLLTQLNAKKTDLLPPVLYVAAMFIDKTEPTANLTVNKIADQVYTGKALKPAVTIKVDGVTLRSGIDYKAEYTNNTELGTATVKVTGIGGYQGTTTATFKIVLGKLTNLKASPSITSANLTWTAVAGATKYEITGSGITKQTVTANKATISGLKADTKYTATVKAIRGSGSSSANVTFTTTPTKPAKVSGLKVSSITATSAKLTWSKAANATGYIVEYHNGSKWVVANKNVTATSYTVSKLTANKTYQFRVRSFNKGKVSTATTNGDYSAAVKKTTLLATPGSFKIASATNNSVKLTWAKVAGATGYTVEYYNGSKWVSKNVTATNYTITKLKANTSYKFRVKAYSKSNNSAYSTTLTGSTALSTKVSGVKITSTTSDTIKVSWSKVSGATGYKVYYSDGKKWSSVTTTKTNVTISKLKANTAYQIKVVALKKSSAVTAESPASAIVKTTSKVAAPTSLKASKTAKNSITLSWKKVAGASGYDIYRNGKKVGTVKSGSTVSFTDKGLKRRTTYKYKVVAYKVVSKKNVYGNYSSQISAKTK
ncbi:MAG: fibronectin type III domain-containing protein [Faecalibacterium sp.]|nr:fibronectin type III domain-containing protein [Ruminococcus sp.]MCM1392669.1 fibronectin type III domain-containing protein [Ruminococcus sp.]MCM1486337.1 fibronectin type III domain-containing protein [Faecalibacterium sp.]